MQRRYLGLVAAGLVTSLAAGLSGCGTSGAGSDQVSLKLIAAEYGDRSGNSSKRYWDQLIGKFEFDHPGITIDVDVHDRAQIDRKVAELVKAGEAPDIAQATRSFAGYVEKDVLYDASEVLSTATQGSLITSLAEAGSVRRVEYALPFAASTRALFYNKKLFAKAGIEEPPGTLEELRQAAVALQAAGVDTPYALPLGPEEAQAESMNWMLSGGGGLTDGAGSYDIDSPENVATFTWLRDKLVGAGLTHSDPAAVDRDDAYKAFMNGDVGMLNGHPTLMQLSLESGIQFGTALLPGKTGPVKTTTGVADWMLAFKQNENQEEIRQFLDFVYEEKNVFDFADRYDLLPVTTQALRSMREDEQHKEVRPFLDRLETAQFYPVGKSSWPDTVDALRKTIGGAVAEGADPAKVLGRVQRTALRAEADSTL